MASGTGKARADGVSLHRHFHRGYAMRCRSLIFAALASLIGAATATETAAPPAQPVMTPIPAAAPKDVDSIDHIVAALYDVISGPAGQARDWKRMRSLFVPGGRLMALEPRRKESGLGLYVLSVNDYVALSGALIEKHGFHEREIARRMDRYAHIAHLYSTYEGRLDDDPTVMRGINSIELMNDGARWWIVSVYWEEETKATPLPAEYLPKH
jgi:hypothetical protein